jgi:hypothetical protein
MQVNLNQIILMHKDMIPGVVQEKAIQQMF